MSDIAAQGQFGTARSVVGTYTPPHARVVVSSPLSFANANIAPATEALLTYLKASTAVDVCEVNLADAVAPLRSLFGRPTRPLGSTSSFLVSVPSNTAARGAVSAISASTLNMPVFAHHASDVYLSSASNHLRLFRRLLSPAVEIVPSNAMAELARETGAERVVVVDNSTLIPESHCAALRETAAPTASTSRPIIVGFLGALSGDHGAVELLEAFSRLADSGLAIELHVAGSMDDMETAATLLEIGARHPHRVHHSTYPVDSGDRVEWFNDIDIFVHPTADRSDAQPMEIYEAAAAGCAVLASNVGAIGDQLETIGGYLITEGDSLDSQIKRVMGANAGIAGVRAMRERRAIRFANHRKRSQAGLSDLLSLFQNSAN